MEDLAELLNGRLDGSSTSRRPYSVFRVDDDQRRGSEKYYSPKLVSIGPYHHGEAGLIDMEGEKFSYLSQLLDRGKTQVFHQSNLNPQRSTTEQSRLQRGRR
ncbi:unnamed protein product [Linum tenue]|uniref:Uncharacterized protein n=1 Tax=Linum tenue TaxID=586396 RepID=A0AAV0LR89_9ROSI|nr:unnamed protein product [Linum tenue]